MKASGTSVLTLPAPAPASVPRARVSVSEDGQGGDQLHAGNRTRETQKAGLARATRPQRSAGSSERAPGGRGGSRTGSCAVRGACAGGCAPRTRSGDRVLLEDGAEGPRLARETRERQRVVGEGGRRLPFRLMERMS